MANKTFEQKVMDIRDNICDGAQFDKELSQAQIRDLSDALRQNISLKRLNLFKTNLGRHGLPQICGALANHPTITTLNIRDNLLTCPRKSLGVLFLNNKSIKKLTIELSQIDGDDLKELFTIVSNSCVDDFILFCNAANQAIALQGSIELIQKNLISELYLPIHTLTRWGAHSLAQALTQNTRLESLAFDEYRCKLAPGALQPILEAVKNHPHLNYLQLGMLESDADYQSLVQFLAGNQSVVSVSISNELEPHHLQFAVATWRDRRNALRYFGYQDHFTGTEAELDTFHKYRDELNELLDSNCAKRSRQK